MPLSDETVAALIECVANSYTHSELDVLFLRLGCAGADENDYGERGNKSDRVRRVILTLRDPYDDAPLIALVREFLEVRFKNHVFDPLGNVNSFLARLVQSLRTDGFDIVDGRIIATTPEPASLAPQLTVLGQELQARGLNVAAEHFQQAVDSFVDGRLEAANGQLRSFLEALLIALYEQTTGKQTRDARGVADRLRDAQHLDGDEARLTSGLVGLSNTRGAHHGLTDYDEALFRLHATTAVARYLLARIPSPKKPRRKSGS